MNHLKHAKVFLSLLLLVSLFIMSACGGSGSPTPAPSTTILTAIHISAHQISIATNSSLQLQATAIYSDNSTSDITNQVNWSLQDDSFANINNSGLIAAISPGSTIITASFQNINATANLTVTTATLDQIEVTPATVTIAEGSSAFLHANGIFSDQTTQDLTSQVSWQSSDALIAEVNSSGQVTGLNDGSVTITASMDDIIATTTVTITDVTLTSLSITPGSASIALGAQYQFTASGHYSDGSTQDLTQQVSWSVLNNSIMDFVNGLAGSIQGKAIGSTTLTASFNGTSSQILVNITAAVINKLEISSTNTSIALGSNLPLQATAIYSDATSQLVTNQTIWISSEPDFATIDSNGVVQSHSPGTTSITALHNGISSSLTVSISNAILSRIEITPLLQSLPAGISQVFFATGIYSDNSVQDLTQLVTWSSTNTGIASIDNSSDNKGLCTAISVGQTTISADLGSISGSKLLTVTDAVLTSIEISPGSSVISKGLSQTYNAIGHFSDGSINDVTNQAVWSTSNTSIANSVANQTSVILSYNSGNVTVSANIGGIYGFTSLTINDAVLTSITIDQLDITIAKGTNFQFTASGHYSDDSTHDLSDHVIWESSLAGTATIQNSIVYTGLASGISEGVTAIRASYKTLESNTALTVTSATLSSIALSSDNVELLVGQTLNITAMATYSDLTTQDISNNVTWQSDATSLAVISNAVLNKGEVIAYAVGSVGITATFQGTSSPALTLTVQFDPDAPISVSTVATPNVILNNNTDSTTISAVVQAADSAGVIADTTVIEFIITDNNVETIVTKNTVNGVATHTLTSGNTGFISVKAQIHDSDISSTSNILSTNKFTNVILPVAYIDPIYDNGTYLTGSKFGILAINLSNRSFNIEQFAVLNGGEHLPDSPHSGSNISGGLLDGGKSIFVIYSLEEDTADNGITISILFTETVTGIAPFGFGYNITYASANP